MTKVEHSPGPWQVADHTDKNIIVAKSRPIEDSVFTEKYGEVLPGPVALCYQSRDCISPQEAQANARLCAAAPDLLHALDTILGSRHWCIDHDHNRTYASLRLRALCVDAVDKARGINKSTQAVDDVEELFKR